MDIQRAVNIVLANNDISREIALLGEFVDNVPALDSDIWGKLDNGQNVRQSLIDGADLHLRVYSESRVSIQMLLEESRKLQAVMRNDRGLFIQALNIVKGIKACTQ